MSEDNAQWFEGYYMATKGRHTFQPMADIYHELREVPPPEKEICDVSGCGKELTFIHIPDGIQIERQESRPWARPTSRTVSPPVMSTIPGLASALLGSPVVSRITFRTSWTAGDCLAAGDCIMAAWQGDDAMDVSENTTSSEVITFGRRSSGCG